MARKKTRGGKVSNDQLSLFESFEWFTEIDISNVEGEKSEGILPIEERPDASFDSHGTGTNSTDGREQISEILHGNEPTTSESFGPSEPNGFDELQQLGDATDERPSESVAEQLDDHESDEPLTNYHIVLTDERLNNDQKFENNIHAIETLVNTAGRKHLTDEEKNTLAHYTGWGGLPHVFDEYNFEWSERRNKLKYLLTEEQYDSARASTLDSFYTPYIVIEKMYEMVQKLGFEHGLILDPSMGNGNYFGMMPRDMMERSLCVGCELDEITGKIAQKLYPKEDIHICGFQNLDIQNKTVDMAISNIPFGSYKVNDKEYNSFNFDIHNYFFAKSIDKVRAGGLVAFITSTETLDGNSKIREYIAERCDLVAAFRLPNNTFRMNGANTSVNSDIIILKKLDQMRILDSDNQIDWLKRTNYDDSILINHYFITHPNNVLGNPTTKTNQYGKPTLVITSNGTPLEELLDSAIKSLPENIYESIDEDEEFLSIMLGDVKELPITPERAAKKNNSYFIDEGSLVFRNGSKFIVFDEAEPDYKRIFALTKISTLCQEMIQEQMNGIDDDSFQLLLSELNNTYDSFVKKFGYITSFKNKRVFRADSNFYLINALEIVSKDDENKKVVEKAAFFHQRTIAKVEEITKADDINDAYVISMNEYGKIDYDYIAQLLHISRDEAIQQLSDTNKIMLEPVTEEWIPTDEYLCGNVRVKYEEALNYSKSDSRFLKNAELLKNLVPENLTADQIKAPLGAPWIPEEYINEFYEMTFDIKRSYYEPEPYISYNKILGKWMIQKCYRYNGLISTTWGVPKSKLPYHFRQPEFTGLDLFETAINNGIPTIYDHWTESVVGPDGFPKDVEKRRVNAERTSIARDKMAQLEMKWEEWLYETLERRSSIEKIYNGMFNSHINKSTDGSFLHFPSMNPAFKLEKFQKDAVAKIMLDGNTLLDQVVGAGKTLEMIAAGMEMKRMGLKHNIMYVVPNSLVDQWAQEFYKFYPNANILATTPKDFTKEHRNLLLHRFATNDYDAMIIPHSCFGKIPLSPVTIKNGIKKQLDELEYAIEASNDTGGRTSEVKKLESLKKNLLARLEKLSDTSRDTGITFEQLGVDMLFVDESHEFKNLLVVSRLSNVAGVPNTDSQKANDMYLKTSYLNENNRGNVCFATGTPISNTMAELYNIQRYLQEDEMRERFNIHSFDGWAKTFGQVTSSFEISVDGKSFRNRMRFCKFFNVPELMNMFRDVAIIMTKSQLAKAMEDSELQRANSKAPGYIGGKPVIISNEASPELENFMSEIVERTEAIHAGGVDAKEDNMLLVTTESKKASLDLRLLGLQDEGTKLANVINSAFAVYKEYDDDNAAQLIFCDSSVPDPNNWNVYDHLKRGLMDKGVPENEIFFIHDAKTDIQRHELFQKVRKGYIRFLIGSTKKMGAGMNVQDRLIAIHHVDVPWRASDIEQRNGRGFRQGNQYDEIYEFRYVTKQSFDAYSWQMIETKASYSNQLMEGNSGMREIEEDSRAMFSYAEVKAIASGNPLIKEKMELEQEVKRLQNLKSGFNKEKWAMEKAIVDFPAKLHEEQNRLARFNADIELRDTNFGNWTLKSTSFNSEQIGEAGDYLLKLVERLRQDDRYRQGNRFKLGTFNGFELQIKKHFGDEILILKGQNEYQIDDSLSKMPRTNIERLSRKLNTITDFRNRTNERIESLIKDNTLYKEKVNDVFIYEDLLKKSELRLREVDELLSPDKESNNVVFDENESKDSEFDETEDEMEI